MENFPPESNQEQPPDQDPEHYPEQLDDEVTGEIVLPGEEEQQRLNQQAALDFEIAETKRELDAFDELLVHDPNNPELRAKRNAAFRRLEQIADDRFNPEQ